MLNNEDLNTINKVVDYLFNTSKNYKDDSTLDLALELRKVADKVYRNKKISNVKSNEYNKNNKKYHCLINSLSYHRKRNNQAKVKEIEEKLKEYKNTTI